MIPGASSFGGGLGVAKSRKENPKIVKTKPSKKK